MDTLSTPADASGPAVLRLVRTGEVICAQGDLTEGGQGVRFAVNTPDGVQPAFAIRYHGEVYAYLNRCAHQSVQLDWNEGDFFSHDLEYLICATHGARYHPVTGACVDGRCNGRGLTALAVCTREQQVVLFDMCTEGPVGAVPTEHQRQDTHA